MANLAWSWVGVHICQLYLMARDSAALLAMMASLSDVVHTRTALHQLELLPQNPTDLMASMAELYFSHV